MINIDTETNKFINTCFPNLTIRDDKIIIKGKNSLTIPSKLYPLNNQRSIKLFCCNNTNEITNTKLKNLFDEINFPLGRCYSNNKKLKQLFNEAGIKEIETYVGWIIIGDTPIHHCWIIYNGVHLIDGGVSKFDLVICKYIIDNNITNIAEQRKLLSESIINDSKKLNSEVKTFGQASPLYVYIGTLCSPEEGAVIFNNLIKKYPNHPAYKKGGTNAHGASVLQNIVYSDPRYSNR